MRLCGWRGFPWAGATQRGFFRSARFWIPLCTPIRDPETDLWIWRIRELEDRTLTYGKVFFGKSGWLSRDWYPVFLAARRRGRTLDEMYGEGLIGRLDRDLYPSAAWEAISPKRAPMSSRYSATSFVHR